MASEPTTYWDYISVEQLLGLQRGLASDDAELSNDEVLFITVHQIDELWFKLILRELGAVRDCFARDPVPEQKLSDAVRGIRRTALLFNNVARHFELMETITTRDYLEFRDKLTPASGFQSAQMREIEILMGLEESQRVPLGPGHGYLQALRNADGSESNASRRVLARLEDRPTLKTAVEQWLYRTPIQGSQPHDPGDEEVVSRFVDAYGQALRDQAEVQFGYAHHEGMDAEEAQRLEEKLQRDAENAHQFIAGHDVSESERSRVRRLRAAIVFIESYRELPLLAWPREVLDGLIALEQASVIFRQRHARMVERVIGRRTGTGGSAGVEYLDTTALRYRVFGDLWAVRTVLLREDALPPLEQAQHYRFVGGTESP